MNCPVCNEQVILPSGPKGDILFIRGKPNEKDANSRTWNDNIGGVLRQELYIAGLDINNYRHAILFNHSCKQDGCADFSLFKLVEELAGKKLIVLVGADAVRYFTNDTVSVDDVAGLDITDEIGQGYQGYAQWRTRWLAFEAPGFAFAKGVGEIRFCIDQFKKMMEEL